MILLFIAAIFQNKLGSCYQKIGFGTKFFEKITKTEVLHQKWDFGTKNEVFSPNIRFVTKCEILSPKVRICHQMWGFVTKNEVFVTKSDFLLPNVGFWYHVTKSKILASKTKFYSPNVGKSPPPMPGYLSRASRTCLKNEVFETGSSRTRLEFPLWSWKIREN